MFLIRSCLPEDFHAILRLLEQFYEQYGFENRAFLFPFALSSGGLRQAAAS